MLLRTLPACRAVCDGRHDSSCLGRRRCRPRVTSWVSLLLVGRRLLSVVGRLSSAPPPRPSLWPWIGGVPSVLSVLGARRGPPPLPPRRVPCRALRGCRSCVLSRRGSRSCAPGLRPRRPLLTYVVGVAVPAALVQLRPRRLCYIGTWAPKALCLVVVWVTSGEEWLQSLGFMPQAAECLALVPKAGSGTELFIEPAAALVSI